MNPIELAANLLTTLSILLAGRNSIHTWWTGILGCGLFCVVFREARLYADVTLQVFFIASSILGWWRWRQPDRARAPEQPRERPISRAARAQWIGALLAGLMAALIYGSILHRYTDAYAPFLDSLVLSLSVVGQWLLMERRLQTWPVWMLVNLIAVPLYASRGLHLTAGLYGVYLVNAVWSWRRWSHLLRDQENRQIQGQGLQGATATAPSA